MARIRSIHPEVCRDDELALVSASAERTFTRLWCHLDDEGRAKDHPKLLAADLYPLHDDMGDAEVDADLHELAVHGLVLRYEVDGKRYLSAKPSSWAEYQKPRHPTPSKLPPPPDGYTPPTEDCGSPTADGRKPHAGVGVGGGVGEGEGDSPEGGAEAPPPSNGREPYTRKLARQLRDGHDVAFAERATLHEAFQDLLTAALDCLPADDHHDAAMGVIADFVERAQGISMTREARSHTARLVRTHDPPRVLHGFGEALLWGAGTTDEYAADPLALSRYVAGVLSDRKAKT